MTTKTENLEAWEALKLLQEGSSLVDKFGETWMPAHLSPDSQLLLESIVNCAPFRLAKVEQKDIGFKGLDPYIVGLVKELVYSEARNIAQDEIAKLRKEIGYGTITISKEAIVASKDDSWSEKIKRFQEREAERNYISPKVTLSGQDRGEPNE